MNMSSQWLTPKRLLWASVAVALITIGLKTGAWWLTDSVGLLSDAMESLVNLASAMFGLMMVTIAERPADEDHPYGHHKAEYFSSGFEGILIIVAGLGILWTAGHRVFDPQPIEQVGLGLALSVGSSVLNGLLAWVMFRAAREHRSLALEADARHLVTDVWTSVGVVGALIAVPLTGWQWLDGGIAIVVALNILKEGGHLIWHSSQGLMDEAIDPEHLQAVENVLQRHTNEQVYFDSLATRSAGQRSFAQVHMHVPAQWTLGKAARLRRQVEEELMAAVPGLHATLEMLPEGSETALEALEKTQ